MVVMKNTKGKINGRGYNELEAINDFVNVRCRKENDKETESRQRDSKMAKVQEFSGVDEELSNTEFSSTDTSLRSESDSIDSQRTIGDYNSGRLQESLFWSERGNLRKQNSSENIKIPKKIESPILKTFDEMLPHWPARRALTPPTVVLREHKDVVGCGPRAPEVQECIKKARKMLKYKLLKDLHAKKNPCKSSIHDVGKIKLDCIMPQEIGSTAKRTLKKGGHEEAKINILSPSSNVLDLVKLQRSAFGTPKKNPTPKTFFVGNRQRLLPITSATDVTDYTSRELFGMLTRRTSTGSTRDNYFKVDRNFFYCFRSTKHQQQDCNREKEMLPCIGENGLWYKEKYRIPLVRATLFLVIKKNPYKRNIFNCFRSEVDKSCILDITRLDLKSLTKRSISGYSVSFYTSDGYKAIDIEDLEFFLANDESYFWFRSSDVNAFPKWLLALQMRILAFTGRN